jgi:hypothetical protein
VRSSSFVALPARETDFANDREGYSIRAAHYLVLSAQMFVTMKKRLCFEI